MKYIRPGKEPAQMHAATSAHSQLPGVAGEPGKLAAFFACNPYTRGLIETADIKEQTCRVEEHMPVSGVDKSSLFTAGQGELAPAAANRTAGFVSFFSVLPMMGRKGLIIACKGMIRPPAKAIALMWRLCEGCQSHSSEQWRPPGQRWCVVVAEYGLQCRIPAG